MRKRWIALLLAGCLLLGTAQAAVEIAEIDWVAEKRAHLRVGNTTELRGCFFTTMWGGETSDLDVQDLLHAYSLVRYDHDDSQFEFDESVVEDAELLSDSEGNRTYLIVLWDDLKWSNGKPVTAYDYAFSILFCMDPVIAETNGNPMDYSWIDGSDEYLARETESLAGLRVISDDILQIRVKAEALPYFYELARLMIRPYPASAIAPGISVKDDGAGAYLSEPLTADMIRQTVLDPKTGYLTRPSVVSGPYTLTSFDGVTARFRMNPNYKGNWEGYVPHIGEIEYTLAFNQTMIEQLKSGELDLLDKVTMADTIRGGIRAQMETQGNLAMQNEPRVGLMLLWFIENSPKVQDAAVRQAIACCFDRDAFIRDYVGPFGMRMDGLYGMGQWPYQLAAGQIKYPVPLGENPTEEERKAHDAAVQAWQGVSLDGLTTYQLNTKAAVRLLEKSGWNLNEEGKTFVPQMDSVRYKQTDDGLVGLELTMAMPGSAEARQALETHLAAHLKEAGISLTISQLSMENLEDAYQGRLRSHFDLLYLGEDFTIYFNPAVLAPQTDADTALRGVKEELYLLAEDMVHTDPKDLPGFMRKWVHLQERITETLPLIPVYSNMYFDFFTRALHGYRIDDAVTWGEAIVKSIMSDIEILQGEQLAEKEEELSELDHLFDPEQTEEAAGEISE